MNISYMILVLFFLLSSMLFSFALFAQKQELTTGQDLNSFKLQSGEISSSLFSLGDTSYLITKGNLQGGFNALDGLLPVKLGINLIRIGSAWKFDLENTSVNISTDEYWKRTIFERKTKMLNRIERKFPYGWNDSLNKFERYRKEITDLSFTTEKEKISKKLIQYQDSLRSAKKSDSLNLQKTDFKESLEYNDLLNKQDSLEKKEKKYKELLQWKKKNIGAISEHQELVRKTKLKFDTLSKEGAREELESENQLGFKENLLYFVKKIEIGRVVLDNSNLTVSNHLMGGFKTELNNGTYYLKFGYGKEAFQQSLAYPLFNDFSPYKVALINIGKGNSKEFNQFSFVHYERPSPPLINSLFIPFANNNSGEIVSYSIHKQISKKHEFEFELAQLIPLSDQKENIKPTIETYSAYELKYSLHYSKFLREISFSMKELGAHFNNPLEYSLVPNSRQLSSSISFRLSKKLISKNSIRLIDYRKTNVRSIEKNSLTYSQDIDFNYSGNHSLKSKYLFSQDNYQNTGSEFSSGFVSHFIQLTSIDAFPIKNTFINSVVNVGGMKGYSKGISYEKQYLFNVSISEGIKFSPYFYPSLQVQSITRWNNLTDSYQSSISNIIGNSITIKTLQLFIGLGYSWFNSNAPGLEATSRASVKVFKMASFSLSTNYGKYYSYQALIPTREYYRVQSSLLFNFK